MVNTQVSGEFLLKGFNIRAIDKGACFRNQADGCINIRLQTLILGPDIDHLDFSHEG
jgi:hypothetical protein